MGVFKVKGRELWAAKWRDEGKQRVRYFKLESEANDFDSERIEAKNANNDRITLIELVVFFIAATPIKTPIRKRTSCISFVGMTTQMVSTSRGQASF